MDSGASGGAGVHVYQDSGQGPGSVINQPQLMVDDNVIQLDMGLHKANHAIRLWMDNGDIGRTGDPVNLDSSQGVDNVTTQPHQMGDRIVQLQLQQHKCEHAPALAQSMATGEHGAHGEPAHLHQGSRQGAGNVTAHPHQMVDKPV